MNGKLKTYIFTIFFGIIGGIMIWKNFNYPTLPLTIFYLILLVNTFFSIEFFARIIPKKRIDQDIIDLSMVAIYLILILNLGNEVLYILSATILFIIATLKYAFLLDVVALKVLKKKIIIDISGAIACSLALAGSLLGYGEITNWIWTSLFLIANIYFLGFKPMYEL